MFDSKKLRINQTFLAHTWCDEYFNSITKQLIWDKTKLMQPFRSRQLKHRFWNQWKAHEMTTFTTGWTKILHTIFEKKNNSRFYEFTFMTSIHKKRWCHLPQENGCEQHFLQYQKQPHFIENKSQKKKTLLIIIINNQVVHKNHVKCSRPWHYAQRHYAEKFISQLLTKYT
jgi:hypothetical protein